MEGIMFQLKNYVLEIHKTGSFSQAAANLYVSQPSLSASIRRLEKKIGEPLFDRSTYPVQLTPCGQAYIHAAQMIASAENDFDIFVKEYGNCQTGKLVIGGSNMNISFILPPLVKRFQATYPGIQLELCEGNIDNLKQLLLEGKLDFIIDSCQMDPERFSAFPYQSENLLLAVPADFSCNERLRSYRMTKKDVLDNRHTTSQQPALPLEKMKGVPFVFPTPETDTCKRALKLCEKAGLKPNVLLSFHQQATVFHTICAGLGAAFVSDRLIKNVQADPALYYYRLGGHESVRDIQFFKKKEKHMSRAMQAFLDIVQA